MPRRARFTIPDLPRDRPTVPELVPLIRAVYALPMGGAGCCLHVVTDDGNYSSDLVVVVYQGALERRHPECIRAAAMMTRMTKTQLRKAVALALAPRAILSA